MPDIRKLILDIKFEVAMRTKDEEVYISFKEVVTKLLGNLKATNY